jgi:Fe2+ transport system protein FeoA
MTQPADSDLPVPSLCGEPRTCSLAQAKAGACLTVRELKAPADVAIRLRELGFCEQQRVRLLSKHTNVICQVCNVRLGISKDLASMIVVEPTQPNGKARPQ